VIGANSVVTGEIPDYTVAVGAPARVVKRLRPRAGRRVQRVRSRGGAQAGIWLSPAKVSSFSLTGMPSASGS
jgi:hypothetical protein